MNQSEAISSAEYLELGGDFPPTLASIAIELRRLSIIEAQRDALLEALREIGGYTGEGPMYSTPWQDIVAHLGQTARAAIAAVEENPHR